jgi:hypothetical protein
MTDTTKFVLFVDILGFASLTEQYPLDVETLSHNSKLGYPTTTHKSFQAVGENQLSRVFSDFHSILSMKLSGERFGASITSIVFSDSAFIAIDNVDTAFHISSTLMHSALCSRIPVRMGIGYGTFIALRFKSDIGLEWGDHASQFLGTAVVRAHKAESCGIKGYRILLHPSMMRFLNTSDFHVRRYPPLECADTDVPNKADVRNEINYWAFHSGVRESEAWRGFQDMWARTPSDETIHPSSTADAINRMGIIVRRTGA